MVWQAMQRRALQGLCVVGLIILAALHSPETFGPAEAWRRAGLALLYAASLACLPFPRVGRPLLLAALAASVLHVLWPAWGPAGPQAAPVLDFLLVFTLIATAFISPALGDAVTLASLLALAPLPWLRPAWREPVPLDHVVNLCLSLALQQAALRSLWREVNLGRDELEGLSGLVASHLRAVSLMSRTAFQEARRYVTDLRQRLNEHDLPGAAAEAGRLGHELDLCRRALPPEIEPPSPGRVPERLRAIRRSIAGFVLLGGFLAAVLAWLHTRMAHFDMGWYAPAWAVLLGLIAAAYLSPWGRRRWLFWAGTLVSLGFLLRMAWTIGQLSRGLPSNGCGALLVLSLAAMADGEGLVLACAALVLVFLLGLAAAVPELPLSTGLLQLAAALAAALALCRVPKVLLKGLHDEGEALHRAAATRRRLVSTLFHDLANPLQDVLMQMELGRNRARVSRLAGRMEEILDVAERLEHGLGPLQRVDLEGLAFGLRDLYKDRLRAKELTLMLELDGAGHALAWPVLLRESVLGNLLSNAIKFSPRRGQVTLRLRRRWKGKVELQMIDQGAGVPPHVLEALSRGRRPESSQGTNGEPGSGYGLSLARDYMAQMGGELRLENPAAGGTRAVLLLASA
jgi:signal transduction histidine kinase